MRVSDVLDALASSVSIDELLADFPYLTRENVNACLAYDARWPLNANPYKRYFRDRKFLLRTCNRHSDHETAQNCRHFDARVQQH